MSQAVRTVDALRAKVEERDPAWLARLPTVARPAPTFREVSGDVESWERGVLDEVLRRQTGGHDPTPSSC